VLNAVGEAELEGAILGTYRQALAVAGRIVGAVEARDVVHDAVARVMELAPYLRGGDSSVGAYFVTVVWSKAVRAAKVRRRFVFVSPEVLLGLEKQAWLRARGRRVAVS